ncbi:MAG: type II toxin-antitoxin system RelE/ParE family toxin [Flavobacteriales bacterium]|nr:type II toxin-antitoxin system RelE/ParE family toxin [Flavobacteriales bacterium]
MAQIVWSPSAVRDLHAIHDRIAMDSVVYALRTVVALLDKVQFLSAHPMSGHRVPEFTDARIREVQVLGQRIIHRVVGEQLHILRIFHAKRLLKRQQLR